jgi:glutaredoxin
MIFPRILAIAAAAALALPVAAETLYKVIGADGKVSYTDRPPVDAKSSTTLTYAEVEPTPLPPSVLKYRADLQKGADLRMAQARTPSANTPSLILFSASWCGQCRRAKTYLNAKGLRYQEYDVDTPDGASKYFASGGGKGVPLLLADGRSLLGFSENYYNRYLTPKK